MHSNGKIILAFLGQIDDRTELISQQNELEGAPVWLSRDDFEKIKIEPGYRELVFKNW